MILRLKTAVKTSCISPLIAAIDAAATPGYVQLYSGNMPASIDDMPGVNNTMLAKLTLSDPSAVVSGGIATFSPITQDSAADATGVARWGRFFDGDGNTVADFDVTTTGGGGTLQMNTTSILIGGPVLISSFVISVA